MTSAQSTHMLLGQTLQVPSLPRTQNGQARETRIRPAADAYMASGKRRIAGIVTHITVLERLPTPPRIHQDWQECIEHLREAWVRRR